MLKLKLQYFGHLMWRANLLEKTLMLGKIEGRRRRRQQRMRWLASSIQCTWTWANSGKWWGTGKPVVLLSEGLRRVGHDLATGQQQQNDLWTSMSFHVLSQHPSIFSGELFAETFYPFKRFTYLPCYWIILILYIFYRQVLCWMYFCKYFLLFY